ncbi:TetR/AcrR family transcriptional regulator C-terminal domain-containing protein [Rhizobium sp. CFBP 8762]|uniref:TetR/AcrR family transcriptional regulator C-terminal domain-containing protein n=1 Tax=Rhizobium sp. CFBP 8762 TaxID=2775279 RepID=UPI00313DDEFC
MLAGTIIEEEYTPRQNAVLEEALRLLVKGGEKALTTAGVARAANCSKESLYKWFGDRDGLLSAMISFQASKVRTSDVRPDALTRDNLREHLVVFAHDLLEVLSGEVSLALNRLAIGQASREGSKLGQLLQERGRLQVGRRAGALLEAARLAGLLRFDDRDEAYGLLYGLIVTDLHLRLMLGADARALKPEFSARAERAVGAFLTLFAKT